MLEITIRLVVAMVLGGIIGLERDYRAKDAGFRTHFLVAVGSALFTLISMYGFIDGIKDSSRVAAQVVSGIGFLGAGLIVLQKKRDTRTHHRSRPLGHGSCGHGVRHGQVLHGSADYGIDAFGT